MEGLQKTTKTSDRIAGVQGDIPRDRYTSLVVVVVVAAVVAVVFIFEIWNLDTENPSAAVKSL